MAHYPAAAYDYSSRVLIAYSAKDRAIDSILAIDGRADAVRLYFMHGSQLPTRSGFCRGREARPASYTWKRPASWPIRMWRR